MQKSVKYALVAVVVVILGGGFGFWWFVLRDDAPERASLPVRTTDTTGTQSAGSGGGSAAGSADGEWTVQVGEKVFVGYRIKEIFVGETVKKTAVGRTSAVSGTMSISGNQVTKVDIAADMTKLKSDEARRDNSIRDNGLQTNTHQQATFTLTEPLALPAALTEGQPVSVTAKGRLTLHGQTRDVEIPLQSSWNGQLIDVAGGAPIVLADYGIEPPHTPLVSVDDNGEFELQLTFARA